MWDKDDNLPARFSLRGLRHRASEPHKAKSPEEEPEELNYRESSGSTAGEDTPSLELIWWLVFLLKKNTVCVSLSLFSGFF